MLSRPMSRACAKDAQNATGPKACTLGPALN